MSRKSTAKSPSTNRKSSHRTSKSQKGPGGFIRIIAGQHRGRKLPVHDVEGLRPTTDRVKETVFNWLMNQIAGTRCLDAFAGAGSLGFEALSRGAAEVTLIEKDSKAAAQIRENLATLKATNGTVHQGDCLAWLPQCQNRFDLVFIDPPFRQNLAQTSCELLAKHDLLAEDALIYVEIEQELRDFTPPADWQLLKEKTAGQVSFRLYQRQV